MMNQKRKRITALMIVLAMLFMIMPASTVKAEQTTDAIDSVVDDPNENGVATVADGEIVTTSVGNTQYIYIAEGRQMLVSSFFNSQVDDNTAIIADAMDSSVASVQKYTETGGTENRYYVLITGITANKETKFTLKNGTTTKTYTVRVFPASTQNNTATRDENNKLFVSYFKISLKQGLQMPKDSGLYFALNGGELYPFENTNESPYVIDQGVVGRFTYMYFFAPGKENALVGMSASGTMGNFYVLDEESAKKDGQNSIWWDVGNTPLGNGSITEDALEKLFSAALEKGCNSVAFMNRRNALDLTSEFSFITQELPKVSTSLRYRKKGTESWIAYPEDGNVELSIGDELEYTFTIDNLDTAQDSTQDKTKVIFSDIVLKCDPLTDFGFTITEEEIKEASANTKSISKVFQYTISENDLRYYTGGKLTLNLTLSYSYSSSFCKKGSFTDIKRVDIRCAIQGLVSYDWGDLPKELSQGLTLPQGAVIENIYKNNSYIIGKIEGQPEDGLLKVEVKDEYGKYPIRTYQFAKWVYKDKNEKEHEIDAGADFPKEYNETSLLLEAKWTVTDIPKCEVKFQWVYGESNGTETTKKYYPNQTFFPESLRHPGYVQITGNGSYSFIGWFADSAGNKPLDKPMTVTENTTIYGIWKKSGTITFKVENGFSQPCLFHVEGPNLSVNLYVIAERPVTLDGLVVGGTYTITALSGWAWRYDYDKDNVKTITVDEKNWEYTFSHKINKIKWLDKDVYNSFLFKPNEEVEQK